MLLTAVPLKDMGFEPQIKQILDEAFEGSEDMVTEPGQVWALIVTPELKLHDFWIFMARRSLSCEALVQRVCKSIYCKSMIV